MLTQTSHAITLLTVKYNDKHETQELLKNTAAEVLQKFSLFIFSLF